MPDYSIEQFDEKYTEEWDKFIFDKSVNGTFLQSRRFLNYHPKGRFNDASFIMRKGERIVAVCPAVKIEEGGLKKLFSHKGSTYGGIILDKEYYKAEPIIGILSEIDSYFSENYNEVVLKQTPDLFSYQSNDLFEYAFYYCGFSNYIELSTYVDLIQIPGDVLQQFDRNKKRNILKCEKQGLLFRRLETDSEVDRFHELLTINLSKYGIKPIHTNEEILRFKNEILVNETEFYGVFHNDAIMAAGMMFYFTNSNVVHAQNLSADFRFTDYSPITYLYYKIIEEQKRLGRKALSWGISTENKGEDLNFGLIRNKESYGSKYQVNRTYIKKYPK